MLTPCSSSTTTTTHTPQVQRYEAVRSQLGLPATARGTGPASEVLEYVAGLSGLTAKELKVFVDLALRKYETKRVHPGASGVRCSGETNRKGGSAATK